LTSIGENPTYFRTFAADRKQVDFGREKGVFPLVLIQVKSAAKQTVFGLKNKRKRLFYRLNRNSFIFKLFGILHRQVSGDYQRLAYIINDYQGVHFERLSF
jgi:hypothetical protein